MTLGSFLDLSDLFPHLYNQVNDALKGCWEDAIPGARKESGMGLPVPLYLPPLLQQLEFLENNRGGPLPCPTVGLAESEAGHGPLRRPVLSEDQVSWCAPDSLPKDC